MLKSLTSIFAFLLGIFGEAFVIQFVNKLRFWWATCVAEEIKAKADADYNVMFKDSKDLGNPDPDK